MKIVPLSFSLMALLCTAGCATHPKEAKSPPGYNLAKPIILNMPAELDELSGIVYDPKDSSLLGIEDEEGYLYKIHPHHPEQVERWKFGKHGDYEDLALAGDKLFVLRSDGNVYLTHIIRADSAVVEKYKFPETGNYEFESMYYNEPAGQLTLVCKDCEADKKSTVSTYGFSPDSLQFVPGPYQIDATAVAALSGQEKIKFKPSAVAVQPITHDIYILASVNKMLAIAGPDGKIKAVYELDPGPFKQPEGLTFGPNGTMYISNESARIGNATVLIFPYTPNTAQK